MIAKTDDLVKSLKNFVIISKIVHVTGYPLVLNFDLTTFFEPASCTDLKSVNETFLGQKMSDLPLNLNGQLGIFQILSPASIFCLSQSHHFQGPIKVSKSVWIWPNLGQKEM